MARAILEMPPRPSPRDPAARSSRRCRSSRCGQISEYVLASAASGVSSTPTGYDTSSSMSNLLRGDLLGVPADSFWEETLLRGDPLAPMGCGPIVDQSTGEGCFLVEMLRVVAHDRGCRLLAVDITCSGRDM